MASQITHVVYGKKIFERRILGVDWHDFVIGTLFPDIRYLAKLDRNTTHIFNTSENKIPQENAFQAGFYTHCLVDEKREKILHSLGMYTLIPHDYLNATALKMLEDYYTFRLIDDWKPIIQILTDTVREENEYGADLKTIKSWHQGIIEYIQSGPSVDSWRSVLVGIIPEASAEQIAKRAMHLQQDTKVCDILKKVYSLI